MNKKFFALTLISAFFLSACGTPHIRSLQTDYVTDYHNTKYASANVRCDDGEHNQKLEDHIRTYLQKENIQLGDDLLIRCNFVNYNPGNRALRYWIGWGAGAGHSDINVELFDKSNTQISSFRVKADLSIGAFGGSAENMIKDSAEKIVNHIKPIIGESSSKTTTTHTAKKREDLTHICLQEPPRFRFVSSEKLKAGLSHSLQRKNISSEFYSGKNMPEHCQYSLAYSFSGKKETIKLGKFLLREKTPTGNKAIGKLIYQSKYAKSDTTELQEQLNEMVDKLFQNHGLSANINETL